jgi:hypothetical protein
MPWTNEFDLYRLHRYKEKLIQLDYQISTLTTIAKSALNNETNISSVSILEEGLRLLNEIDIISEDLYFQYLKITN